MGVGRKGMSGTNFHPKLERDFCLVGDKRKGKKRVLSTTPVRRKARLEREGLLRHLGRCEDKQPKKDSRV